MGDFGDNYARPVSFVIYVQKFWWMFHGISDAWQIGRALICMLIYKKNETHLSRKYLRIV